MHAVELMRPLYKLLNDIEQVQKKINIHKF
jgi:hypothetical protein